jgi:murein DD-endopeptidase MepM/ murein hydrolase activator NlpD
MKSLCSILKNSLPAKIIDSTIDYSKYVTLDLSVNNQDLTENKLGNSTDLEKYINKYLKKNNAEVAFGGYIETRNLYQRSSIFKNNKIAERNIHLGLDFWIKAETPVFAALNGRIHSFKNNVGLGDYGPTIILEHQIENQKFYTLYGHLSLESLKGIKMGDFFKKGEHLANIGSSEVNGDYAPHLHFQIIKDIENYWGDYPGVCNTNDLNFYMENCPDPNLLLKII